LHLFICIKEVFFTSWALALAEWGKGGPWPANVFFNKHSYCKNIPILTNHHSSLMCWLTLRSGVIKAKWGLATKFFSQELELKFSKKIGIFFRKWVFLHKKVFTFCARLLLVQRSLEGPGCMPSAPFNPPLIKWKGAYWCYFSIVVFLLPPFPPNFFCRHP